MRNAIKIMHFKVIIMKTKFKKIRETTFSWLTITKHQSGFNLMKL